MINGVSVSDNLRGQPYDLYIEDAIQETTVATAGISAEYGRFSGGVVNVITKSGGNLFSGSFSDSLPNDKWRALHAVRTEDDRGRSRARGHASGQDGADLRVHDRRTDREEIGCGSSAPGGFRSQKSGRRAGSDEHAVYIHRSDQRRTEGKVTYSPAHRSSTSDLVHREHRTAEQSSPESRECRWT